MATNPAKTQPSIMNILVSVTKAPRWSVGAYSETKVTLSGMTAPTPTPEKIRQSAKRS